MAFILGAVAIGGSALIGGVTSFLGASETSRAADRASTRATNAAEVASENQLQATRETNKLLSDQYEQSRQDLETWRLAGEDALQRIEETPDFTFDAESFSKYSDPSYQFRQDEALRQLDRSAASRGNLRSGGQDRAVTRYASNLASQEYGNAFNRANSVYNTNLNTDKFLTNVGQGATNATVNAGNALTGQQAQNTNLGTQAVNALNVNAQNRAGSYGVQAGQANANAYAGIAQSANQAIGNYLLADKAGLTNNNNLRTSNANG